MKNQEQVTRADVAKRAGVSETIVSYVLNNNRYVDADKRRRVEEAVRELKYRPNMAARALKGKPTNHIVFIADQIANEHFSKLIAEMDSFAYNMGYMISLCQNRNTNEFVGQIIARHYDGVIISSLSFPEEYIKKLLEARLPVVLLCNREYRDVAGAALIDTGLYEGARECVRHLVSRGRKSIVYLDRFSERGNFSTMQDLRLRGFIDQMKEFGFRLSDESFVTGAKNEEEAAAFLRKRLLRGEPIDAVVSRNDRLACMAMQVLRREGKRLPDDIAVIGFDNSSLSMYTTPTLSTVEIPRDLIGRAAVEMLHSMIENDELPEPVQFQTKLIVREST